MRGPGRWALSPAYDLNPVPEIERTQTPKMPISEDQEEPTISAALAAASRFNLRPAEAQTILREVLVAVSDWRKTGRRLRIKAVTLDAYATAFEHSLIEEARKSC
jgi:serine/threonine-protein kinase HipA